MFSVSVFLCLAAFLASPSVSRGARSNLTPTSTLFAPILSALLFLLLLLVLVLALFYSSDH